MSQPPDRLRVSWDALTIVELGRLARAARQNGRHAMADAAIAELRRRGGALPADLPLEEDDVRQTHPAAGGGAHAPWRWRGVIAVGVVLLALIAVGLSVFRFPSPPPAVVTAAARSGPPAGQSDGSQAGRPEAAPGRDRVLAAASPEIAGGPRPDTSRTRPERRSPQTTRAAQLAAAGTTGGRLESLRMAPDRPADRPRPLAVLAASTSPDLTGGACAPSPDSPPPPTCRSLARGRTAYPATTPARIVVARNMPPVIAPQTPPSRPRW